MDEQLLLVESRYFFPIAEHRLNLEFFDKALQAVKIELYLFDDANVTALQREALKHLGLGRVDLFGSLADVYFFCEK